MKEPIIQNLFPTPVYMTNMDRPFTKQELNFVENEKKHTTKNDGNTSSIDNYILNRKELKNIKKIIDNACEDYLQKIICPKQNLKLYVTQSWLNYTEPQQFHHKHEHPNSVISGVLYFDSDKNNDTIKFFHHRVYQQIFADVEENKFNLWNSTSWWFPVETGQLIMFPSSTTHQVDTKKGNNTRISLAFNTFYKGTIGLNSSLTELIL
jgi:uncharacterized protein (TIGR02466 family)|tara:strand:+ start:2694 stop:3317 length:624 start_codon:yes stop_codon:yes gene_type:complete